MTGRGTVLVVVLGLVLGSAGGVTVGATRQRHADRQYTATARVMLDGRDPATPTDAAALAGQARALATRDDTVLSTLAAAGLGHDLVAVRAVEQTIRVVPVGVTRQVDISLKAGDGRVAARLVNGLANQVVELRQSIALAGLSAPLATLDRKIADLGDIVVAQDGLVANAEAAVGRARDPLERAADVAAANDARARRSAWAQQLNDSNRQRDQLLADQLRRNQASVIGPATAASHRRVWPRFAYVGIGGAAGLVTAFLLIALMGTLRRRRLGRSRHSDPGLLPSSDARAWPEVAEPAVVPARHGLAATSTADSPRPPPAGVAAGARAAGAGAGPSGPPARRSTPRERVLASTRVVVASDRLLPRGRPPLPRGQDAPRLPSEQLRVRVEPVRGEAARAEHRRILQRSLTNLRQAEPEYQRLIAEEPDPFQPEAEPDERESDDDPHRAPPPLPGFTHQVTIDGMSAGFPRARLDRLWTNLVEHGQIALIVPSLSASARDQLLRLGAQAEAELGRPITISVRQTAEDDQPLPPPRSVLLSRLRSESVAAPKPTTPPRPPMPVAGDAPRLPADRFHNWLETMKGDHAHSAQRRILHLALVDPARAELDYQDLVAAEPEKHPAVANGVNQVTTEGMFSAFSEDKLDLFWADLFEHNQLLLTVPSVSAESRDQLLRLGAQAEQRLRREVTIFIRETA